MLSNDQCELDLHPHIKSGLVHEMSNSHMTLYRIAQKGNRFLSNWDWRKELFPVGIEVNLLISSIIEYETRRLAQG